MPNQGRRRADAISSSGAVEPNTRSLEITDDTVRNRAHELYERRGSESGHELDDWLQAERELQLTNEVK
jgi:hypothetical protein